MAYIRKVAFILSSLWSLPSARFPASPAFIYGDLFINLKKPNKALQLTPSRAALPFPRPRFLSIHITSEPVRPFGAAELGVRS